MPDVPPPPEKRELSEGGSADSPERHGHSTRREKTEADREAERREEMGLWRLAGLGGELTGTVVFFAAIGWFVDTKSGWTPWGLLGFGMLGVAVGLYRFIREASR